MITMTRPILRLTTGIFIAETIGNRFFRGLFLALGLLTFRAQIESSIIARVVAYLAIVSRVVCY
jgi:hypothetical protein